MHHLSTGLAVVSLLFATAPHALDDIKELLGSLRKADGAARCLKTMALVWQVHYSFSSYAAMLVHVEVVNDEITVNRACLPLPRLLSMRSMPPAANVTARCRSNR